VALVRPLLAVRREEVTAFLESAGIRASEDPTNQDRHYQRSRIRHEVLPLLRRERGDLDGHLGELAEQVRADADYLDQQAQAALAGVVLSPPGGQTVLSAAALAGVVLSPPAGQTVLSVPALSALPRALSARVLRRFLGPVSHRHVEQVLALCQHTKGTASIELPGGRAERRYQALHLVPCPSDPHAAVPAAAFPGNPCTPSNPNNNDKEGPIPETLGPVAVSAAGTDAPVLVTGPGDYRLGDAVLRIEVLPAPASASPGPAAASASLGPAADPRRLALFDAREVGFPLLLRRVRPGDRIKVRGMAGHKKVSDVLIDDKLPRPARADVVLLCRGDEVLWVAGHRPSATGRPAPDGDGPLLCARLL
jgi:tRNA(Ile)-lysidine synthase